MRLIRRARAPKDYAWIGCMREGERAGSGRLAWRRPVYEPKPPPSQSLGTVIRFGVRAAAPLLAPSGLGGRRWGRTDGAPGIRLCRPRAGQPTGPPWGLPVYIGGPKLVHGRIKDGWKTSADLAAAVECKSVASSRSLRDQAPSTKSRVPSAHARSGTVWSVYST